MLRTLLADRFKLAVHRETKEMPMYALVMARRDGGLGPRLRPTAGDCAAWIAGGRRGERPRVAGDLPCGSQRVIGLAVRGSAMTLQEQLGLKLESTKGSNKILVIDHVEQPSPN
jgi:hypothetical protein